MISKSEIIINLLLGAMLVFALLLAIPVELWHRLKTLFHKQEEERDVEFNGNSRERLLLLTDHTFDTETSWPNDFR